MSQNVNTANNNLPVLRVPQSVQLHDNDQWQNRFQIHSETSNRVYVVAQHKQKRHWGCSCPATARADAANTSKRLACRRMKPLTKH